MALTSNADRETGVSNSTSKPEAQEYLQWTSNGRPVEWVDKDGKPLPWH